MPTDGQAGETLVEVTDLFAGYGGAPVVRGLSLTINAGEVVSLLGPNGAGKTTTLLAISGLLRPMAGSIQVLGERVDASRPHMAARRGLAHVAEDRSLFFDLTVGENLRLGQTDRSKRAAALERAMGLFPALQSLRGRLAGQLSGGEQQMLAMARALVAEPKVLVVDEMSMGLAPIIVERMMPVVRRIADETGTAVLMVEQHVHMALAISDRGYVLNHGEMQLEGAASDLLRRRDLLEMSYLSAAAP